MIAEHPEKSTEERRLKDLDRILSELEKMQKADHAALVRKDFHRLADNQRLKGDFVNKLVLLCKDGVPQEFSDRLDAVMRLQKSNASWLEDAMAANREELSSLLKGRRTVRRLNGSYGTRDRPRAKRTAKGTQQIATVRFNGTA